MKVQIIVSEDIEARTTNQGQINTIINPLMKLRVPFIPAGITFAVTIITIGLDYNQSHTFEVMIEDPSLPDGDPQKKLYSTGIQYMPALGGASDNFNFNLQLKNVPFLRSGEYQVRLHFDEREDYIHTFEVIGNQDFSHMVTGDGRTHQ